ncbi:beta-lactamase class A [Carnobacterium iners]|nr:beta-lactamase class A [Carnobacterium iners]
MRAYLKTSWSVIKVGLEVMELKNDIAVVWPPNREPIVIAILSSQDREDATCNDQLIARATGVVINALK